MAIPQELWRWGEGEATTLRVVGSLAIARPARAYLRLICMILIESDSSGGAVAAEIEFASIIRFYTRIFLWSIIVTFRPVAVVTTCLFLIMAPL